MGRFVMSYPIKIGFWVSSLMKLMSKSGFCLALSSNMEFKGVVFYSCGIGWYLIALIGCIILLNMIMNFEGVRPWKYVIIIAIAGVILGYYKIFVFCISQIFTGLFFFYEGYLIKKKKLFQIERSSCWSGFGF